MTKEELTKFVMHYYPKLYSLVRNLGVKPELCNQLLEESLVLSLALNREFLTSVRTEAESEELLQQKLKIFQYQNVLKVLYTGAYFAKDLSKEDIQQRVALYLFYKEDKELDQIAEVLQISYFEMLSLFHRARSAITTQLELVNHG